MLQVVPVKSFQSSSQVLTEPMPDKHRHDHEHDHHHASPRDLFTADSKVNKIKEI